MPREFLNGLLTPFTEYVRQNLAPNAPASSGARIYTFNADGNTVLEGRTETGGRFRFLRDQLLIGRNNTGATIPAGSFVRVTGWDAGAGVLTIAPADPGSDATMPAVGLTNAAIANGTSGRVWQMGLVGSLNTGGMAVGSELYLAANGTFTTTKPTAAGARLQELGTVVVADAAAGMVHVNVSAGYETLTAAGTSTARSESATFHVSPGLMAWTNMPAALTEFRGAIYHRLQKDLSSFFEHRLTVNVGARGATNAEIRLQYSLDGGDSFFDLGSPAGGANISVGNVTRVSGWIPIAAAAKADVQLRLVGINGDGVLDPSFATVAAEFR